MGMTMTSEHTSLAGKRILLTGGTTGIGRATVNLLAQEDARVLTFGRDEQKLKDALASFADGGGEVSGMTADISTREGVQQVFDVVDDRLGGVGILGCHA